jgi:hypothetical protein
MLFGPDALPEQHKETRQAECVGFDNAGQVFRVGFMIVVYEPPPSGNCLLG